MIDTVRFRQPRPLRESASRRNWNMKAVFTEVADADCLDDERLQSYSGVHRKSGIRFFGNREQIISVEASLPRLLFGHNGKLLLSQAHIHAALRKLHRTLGGISGRPREAEEYTRVDLVWHVPGSCAEFILAHRDVRHPRVRNATCVFDAQSITWPGAALRLLLYDKTKKETEAPGNFVRVEAQLRGHVLNECLRQSDYVLDFRHCYRFLRKLVLQLEPRARPHISDMVSLLAACSRLPTPGGEVHPVDVYLQGLCTRRSRDLRRQMAAVAIDNRAVNWLELMPEEPSPSPPGVGSVCRNGLINTSRRPTGQPILSEE